MNTEKKSRPTFTMRLRDGDERMLAELEELYPNVPDKSTLMRAMWNTILRTRPKLVLDQEFAPN